MLFALKPLEMLTLIRHVLFSRKVGNCCLVIIIPIFIGTVP